MAVTPGATITGTVWTWANGGAPQNTLALAFYTAADALISTHDIYTHPGNSTGIVAPVSVVVPGTAAYMIFGDGSVVAPLNFLFYDDVCLSIAGTAAVNPYAGVSEAVARCDHTHDPAEHDHDAEYADIGHVHGEPAEHEHDYAPDTHDHAATYEPLGHTHDEYLEPGDLEGALETAGHWEPVTNGSVATPEIVFDAGDVVMEWVPA